MLTRSDSYSLRRLFAAGCLVLLLGACAGPADEDAGPVTGAEPAIPGYEVEGDNDPLELPNRFIFAFNQMLDVIIIRPAAEFYRFILPSEARDSIRNALRNLRSPVVLANDLFQGEMDRAETTFVRFVVNSTVGVAGLFDVAEDWGYPYHDEDFGQTLGVHGAGEGFYLVLPLFGPSSARDGVGLVVDIFLDPLTYVVANNDWEDYSMARTALTGIDARERNIETLEDLERDAIDFYARIRSLYRQTRDNAIRNGEADPDAVSPAFGDFEFEDPAADEQASMPE